MTQQPDTFVQSCALVIHRARFGDSQDTFSILAHDIHHTETKSVLGAGRPFGHDDKMSLMAMLGDYRGSDLEFLDAKCLASSHETMMWYRPRSKTVVNIVGHEYTVAVPSLVFMLHKGSLHVAAYKGERRPERNTKLLHCGLPNIQSNIGHWCSGGNRLPDRPHQGQIEKLEDMFFTSPFTHWNPEYAAVEDTSTVGSNKQMETFFKDLQGKARFPVSKLKDMGCELEQWMRHITTRNARF
ncbi:MULTISPECIES: PRTRC system protein B [Marinobacter]|uniref:PRTRC system protein B n=1 Tax=Marinobacter nauticus (strain ATCC 700491 / DSM 11845 / VT8) TaxID=351348 RepID=A1U844_MARN8|nr:MULTISPECIES: PRTRC system protein B [Marinobacter]ABM21163.1 hypothetical protein Maqu_4312 [Marinobacter nauticus VT8]|tara:strand:+ start:1628 stop:2350 length:723 start_codon:yes stop_codon:yes gene_type:complete